ncbi:hypothetical protein DP939_00445 [Spongiactinospora rosea]|uniref:Uncharacterized protein n=1 Tax=Spongiactinospora rosea TaxID=2248750 RepID=A0A366M5C5_9ACTN|nr:hypothetical protein [Spongiactinospora rosea]RBQ21237.1 hypothetical protein DP939_00445 [Spongiactinospora rosea]
MSGFINELERAGQVIAEQAENIRRELAAVDLSAAGLAPIREIGGWTEQELPRLRQRLATINAPMPTLPGMSDPAQLMPYQEASLLAPAEARRQGTALGKRFAALDPDEFSLTGPYASDKIAAALKELSAHSQDAVYSAAFFAALGPSAAQKMAAATERLAEEKQADARMAAGTAFAMAVSGGASVPGFAAVMKSVERSAKSGKPEDDEELEAISALLSHGNYPDVWLAELVQPALLPDSRITGPTLAGLLNALGNNPAAARLAIGAATRFGPRPPMPTLTVPFGPLPKSPEHWDRRPKLAAFLKGLNKRVSHSPEISDAFGRLLAAASGAYDERDGQHGREAALFTYTVMTSADEWSLNDATRVHLSKIAGSYASEITMGADLGDTDMTKDSAMQPIPEALAPITIPGLRGAFRLSPKDTFRFMTTFAGTPQTRRPFEDGMDALLERMFPIVADPVKSGQDILLLDRLFNALGNVRGFELAAAVRVLKPKDEALKNAEAAESFLSGALLGAFGLVTPFSLIPRTWTTLSTGVSAYYTYGRNPKMRVEEVEKLDGSETLARRYEVAQLLIRHGFTPEVPPSGLIADQDGTLRSFQEILKRGDSGMKAIDQWLIDNGMGKGDELSFGELSRRVAVSFDGEKQPAFNRAKLYKDKLTTD